MNVTVVTGAAGALGSSVVEHLVGLGHRVLALDMAAASERLSAMTKDGVVGVACDVTSASSWADALAKGAALGSPTGGVLVAGGWQGGQPFHASDDVTTRAMMEQNFTTAQVSLRALLPGMVARKGGSLVVIGSRAVERPWTSTNAAAYAASKAAVVALAQAVAAEVLEAGVRVNAVLPSTLDTPANRRAMPDADPARWVARESLAGVIAFLLSDASRDVSGAALPVYGRA